MSGSRGGSPHAPEAAPRSRRRRVARLVGWNVLILFGLLLLVAGGAEAYLRLTVPFRDVVVPQRLTPGVGVIRPPHREYRYTNGVDFWAVSRSNGLGFLDREPPDPERAAESCHVTLLGDSFVEGREVALADRVQVRLEELAAREAPALDVTTSAFGFRGTGQISQLAFYDVFARSLSPDVVALVAVINDFYDNSLPFKSFHVGFHPDYPTHLFARRGADGEMEFVPPGGGAFGPNRLPSLPEDRDLVAGRLREWSYLIDRLWPEFAGDPWAFRPSAEQLRELNRRAVLIGRHPRYETFALGWSAEDRFEAPPYALFLAEDPPPAFRDALDVMRFALEQFRERAERDGATLIVLASHTLGGEGDPPFELLRELAGDIPVISQADHVVAAGGEVEDLHWAHDSHWNPTGHRRAAEALLDWLKETPGACS